jgi:hypothetical protein
MTQKPRFCAKSPPLCDNTPPHIGGNSIPLQRNKQETSGEMTRKRLTQKKIRNVSTNEKFCLTLHSKYIFFMFNL